jgi:hypothetical protein
VVGNVKGLGGRQLSVGQKRVVDVRGLEAPVHELGRSVLTNKITKPLARNFGSTRRSSDSCALQ